MRFIPKLNQEYPDKDEAEVLQALVKEFEHLFQMSNPPSKSPATKVTHFKTLACAQAYLTVESNLPPELKVGIFKEAKVYPAWVRFSQTFASSDAQKDSRSMSIKILNVAGEGFLSEQEGVTSQDFLLSSSSLFFVRNAKDFLEFARHIKEPNAFFFPTGNPLNWRLREYFLFLRQLQQITNLLDIPYWGNVPYRFGDRTVQYHAKPHSSNQWKHSIPVSENFLHQATAEYLKNREALFDFFVQFQTDAIKMPIEDATVKWKSPFHKVATLRIPSQDIDSQENMERGEQLIYNPWHCLKEHQPLGSLNRARRVVYAATRKLREERNKTRYHEPQG